MARKRSKGRKPEETMRQRQMRLRKEQQARRNRLARSSNSTPTSQRVERVKVRVEGQRALPGTKSTKALPPGQRGGAVSTGNKPRRRNINSNPSSNTTRTGSQSPSSAAREVQATRRAGTQSRRPGRGGLVAPLAVGAAIGNWMTNNLSRTATPSGRGTGRATDSVKPGPPKKDEKKNSTPSPSTSTSKPRRRGMSNIPPSEGSRNNPNYGKPGKPTSANRNTPPRTTTTTPKPSPAPSTTRAKAKPKPATSSNGQSLRQGRTPDKPATKPATKPAGKVYGSTGRKGLKQSSRMAAALKSLKVRDYKKKK